MDFVVSDRFIGLIFTISGRKCQVLEPSGFRVLGTILSYFSARFLGGTTISFPVPFWLSCFQADLSVCFHGFQGGKVGFLAPSSRPCGVQFIVPCARFLGGENADFSNLSSRQFVMFVGFFQHFSRFRRTLKSIFLISSRRHTSVSIVVFLTRFSGRKDEF